MAARLKVLLGAVQTMMSSGSGATVENTVCLWPGITRSKWISSLMTFTPCFWQISATRFSSSGVHTRPTGLWGLQKIISLLSSSAAI